MAGEGHSERQGLSERHEQSTRLGEETAESRQRARCAERKRTNWGDADRAEGAELTAQLQCTSFQSKVKITAMSLSRRLDVFAVSLKEHHQWRFEATPHETNAKKVSVFPLP